MAHKEDGNHHFKLKKYDKAISAYSEGLRQKFDDADLRVILFTNRAVAQFYLSESHLFLISQLICCSSDTVKSKFFMSIFIIFHI